MAIGLLGLGAAASVSTYPPSAAKMAEQKPAAVPVIVLALEMRAGARLRSEDMAMKEMPSPPEDVVRDAPETRHALIGGMVRRTLGVGS